MSIFFTLNVVRTVRICMCIYYIFIDPLDLNLYIFQYYLYIYGIHKFMYFYSHTFEDICEYLSYITISSFANYVPKSEFLLY